MGITCRLLSLWLGIWFVFVVAEPIPVHECPMHNPLVAARDAMHAAHQQHQQHDGDHTKQHAANHNHVQQGGTHDQHAHSHDAGHSGPSAHMCLCLGCAAGSAPVKSTQATVVIPVPVEIARLQAVYPVVERTTPDPEFILPPSTAPPQLS